MEQSRFPYVELVWPGKDLSLEVAEKADGTWIITTADPTRRLHPFVNLSAYPRGASQPGSLVVSGDRIAVLRTLSRSRGRFARLAYLDLPRIAVDDVESSFRGDSLLVYSTWLTVVRAHLQSVEPVLRRDGVVILHVGDSEEPFVRLAAEEVFRGQRVGTVVWQRAYAPRNMPNMKEFTATHDCLLIYAKDRDSLPPVGLRSAPSGFDNPDGDPRGPWKAEHKGAKARRAKSDFDTYVPPYRWRIVQGRLPNGLWRLNPLTGVIWGMPTETGIYPITIEVSDSKKKTARSKVVITVGSTSAPPLPPDVPWLFKRIRTKGVLRIETDALPDAALNQEYMAIVLGAGGKPFMGPPKRPGSGRYWEFADDTLLEAYQKDAVYLGRDEPTAIPHPKMYRAGAGEVKVENQQSWWPGRVPSGSSTEAFAGYTEDATKHLKALKELGFIESEVSTGKPEHLLARLMDIFTDAGDTVVELFGSSADLASVAIKKGRKFVYVASLSDRTQRLLETCALPRLRCVVDGQDADLESKVREIRLRADAYIPYQGGGQFLVGSLGAPLVSKGPKDDFPTLHSENYEDSSALLSAVLTLEGFLSSGDNPRFGVSYDGTAAAVVLAADEFLTTELAAEYASGIASGYSKLMIYYFRSSSDFDRQTVRVNVTCKRVHFDL